MSDINVIVNDEIVNIDIVDEPVLVNVVNSPGVPGAPGVGVPVGGTTGQVLAKNSATNYDTAWVNVSGGAWGTITGTLSNQTDLQNALNAKVPYTGATANVNLGEYEIKAGQVTLDTSPTGTAAVGTTRWNDTLGSTETTLKGGSVILKNGVDLVARVVNKVSPNTTLTKAAYQAVRVSGAQGQRLAVAFAQANNDNNSADTIGLVIETIATNQEGFIMTVGQIEGINTTGSLQGETWADGDVLYLSPTTAGALTNVKPTGATGHIVVIGYVEYAHAVNGKIYTKVANGWELDELHNLNIVSPTNNQSIFYNSSNQLWENKSIATALGYTPANSATTLTINGVTYDLSTSRTWTISTGITGSGASGQVAYWDGTTSQAGSADLQWNGTNLLLGNDKGIVLQTAGTNRSTRIVPNVIVDNISSLTFYPSSGTNVGQGLYLAPRGTGLSATIKTQFFLFGTDYVADPTNWEGVLFRAKSDSFMLATGKAGTGTIKPLLLSSGYADNSTNSNHLWLYPTGNVGINSSFDGGQRLQVQGTTLLNGNVTFSSSTGMFWDATNSRLGIGTNAPDSPLHINSNITASTNGLLITRTSVTSTNANFQISNGTNNTGEFLPGFLFTSNFLFAGVGNTIGGFFGSRITNSNNQDIGILFEARTKSGTGLSQGYIASFRSFATDYVRIAHNGNMLLQNGGTFTDSGERLQVTGTMKVTGASTFGGNMNVSLNQNSNTTITVSNTTVGTFSVAEFVLQSNTVASFGKTNSGYATFKTIVASDFYMYNAGAGDISILNNFATGNIKLTAGGSSTAHMTIKSNGRINMSSLPTSSTGLATGDLWNDAGTIKIV